LPAPRTEKRTQRKTRLTQVPGTAAGITALARQPIGALRNDPDIRPIFVAARKRSMSAELEVLLTAGVLMPFSPVQRKPSCCKVVK
jgi:hypothetical protein